MIPAMVPLVRRTLREPRAAATAIIGWHLDSASLWSAFGLVSIFNTFVILLALQLSEPAVPLPGYFNQPLALFMLVAGTMAVFIHAMYWTGRAVGGKGDLRDLLALIVWFQFLRATAQLGVIALSLLVPVLGLLAALIVAIWGAWIFLNFVAAGLQLASVGHAIIVLLLSAIGLVLGLGLLAGLIGLPAQGVT